MFGLGALISSSKEPPSRWAASRTWDLSPYKNFFYFWGPQWTMAMNASIIPFLSHIFRQKTKSTKSYKLFQIPFQGAVSNRARLFGRNKSNSAATLLAKETNEDLKVGSRYPDHNPGDESGAAESGAAKPGGVGEPSKRELPSRRCCRLRWFATQVKMTGGTPEVRSNKSLTLMTFNIRQLMDQWTNGPMDPGPMD